MVPASRKGDAYICPVHGPGIIGEPCCASVLIEDRPAARQTDTCICPSGVPDATILGHPLVLIGGLPAVGVSYASAHGGLITLGAKEVYIGPPGAGRSAVTVPPECAYLKHRSNQGQDADVIGQNLNSKRKPHKIRKVASGQDHDFRVGGKSHKADVYEVDVRGRKIMVYDPVGYQPPKNCRCGGEPGKPPPPAHDHYKPTPDQIAKSLATMPDEELDCVDRVDISPGKTGAIANSWGDTKDIAYNPEAKHVRTDSPVATGPELQQADMDWAFVHEGGHQYHSACRNKYGEEKFDSAWRAAAEKDAALDPDAEHVTSYSKTKTAKGKVWLGEDFADTATIYQFTVGTSCEAAARAKFPARFALLDKLKAESKKSSKPGPKTPAAPAPAPGVSPRIPPPPPPPPKKGSGK